MDLLLSFSDFESFKEMMLFARAHLVATTPKVRSSKAAALGLKNKSELQEAKIKESLGKGGDKKLQENELKFFEETIDKLQIQGNSSKLYKEEDEEGTAMPDL